MNWFVEGLQGSGKSTLTRRIAELRPESVPVMEGDYSPVELAWCAYMNANQYREILNRYPELRTEIEAKTAAEGEKRIVCYTKIQTQNTRFYRDLERYEIYNSRVPPADFRAIVLERYRKWNGDGNVFECSLLQNTVEDMILFRNAADAEIVEFYRKTREALDGKDYHIIYLKTEDVRGNLETIRRERTDKQGNELWFPMMMQYFNDSPYAKANGKTEPEDLIRHFIHRQELELRICREVFAGKYTVLASRKYTDRDIPV